MNLRNSIPPLLLLAALWTPAALGQDAYSKTHGGLINSAFRPKEGMTKGKVYREWGSPLKVRGSLVIGPEYWIYPNPSVRDRYRTKEYFYVLKWKGSRLERVRRLTIGELRRMGFDIDE